MIQFQKHIAQYLPVWLILTGLFALFVHPVTHAFTHHETLISHESELPDNHESDDCIECVLTQVLSSDIDLSNTNEIAVIAGQVICEVNSDRLFTLKDTISPRGPPQDYV